MRAMDQLDRNWLLLWLACLRKTDSNASDDEMLYRSAWDKIMEFRNIGYPRKELMSVCCRLWVSTENRVWLTLARELSDAEDPCFAH